MQVSLLVAIWTSSGKPAAFTRLLVLAIARPLVERSDARGDDIDEAGKVCVLQRRDSRSRKNAAVPLRMSSAPRRKNFRGVASADEPRQPRHGPPPDGEADGDFSLRENGRFAARETHFAGQRKLAVVTGRTPADRRDQGDRGMRHACQDVRPRFEVRLLPCGTLAKPSNFSRKPEWFKKNLRPGFRRPGP